ncbi:unnamed protein product [Albugo candida]|uniref:Uncharacterized protein n=1 Tax=Albugo candida TaxID=65357 RepID=A0A024G079_9STRA|nr:unnamed protein product [Albugo candida]|eukprot:CCI39933.1 unnamed protein product [Albugo candida]
MTRSVRQHLDAPLELLSDYLPTRVFFFSCFHGEIVTRFKWYVECECWHFPRRKDAITRKKRAIGKLTPAKISLMMMAFPISNCYWAFRQLNPRYLAPKSTKVAQSQLIVHKMKKRRRQNPSQHPKKLSCHVHQSRRHHLFRRVHHALSRMSDICSLRMTWISCTFLH